MLPNLRSIRGKFFVIVAPLVLAVMTVFGLWSGFASFKTSQEQMVEKLNKLSANQSIVVAQAVAERNNRLVRLLMTGLLADPDVVYASVSRADGSVIVTFGAFENTDETITRPISFVEKGALVGVGEIAVGISFKAAYAALKKNLIDTLLGAALALAAIFMGELIAFRKLIEVPLRQLLDLIRCWRLGKPRSFEIKPRHDEFGDLLSAYSDLQHERTGYERKLEETKSQLESRVRERTEDLRLARDQAECANQAKSEFLAVMSHELRTPLNAIIGFSSIINGETLGPVGNVKYRDYARDINESGEHLLELINDILDLSKIEAGAETLHEEAVSIPDLVASSLRLLRQQASRAEIALDVHLDDGLPLLWADTRKTKQIFVNLLGNAIKFTEPGGTVAFRAEWRADSGFAFRITDTGIGIAAADIPKALAPFEQIEGHLDRTRNGTGLGLPLAKSLAELHDGELVLQSREGEGTTVSVLLPASRAVEEAAVLAAPDLVREAVG